MDVVLFLVVIITLINGWRKLGTMILVRRVRLVLILRFPLLLVGTALSLLKITGTLIGLTVLLISPVRLVLWLTRYL